jgi:hypothetical protein
MINHKRSSAFAIFTVIMLLAVISLISLAMTNLYLTNTRAASLDLQQLEAQHLLDAGTRFAALSLASPRAKVSGSAIPSKHLVYSSPAADVLIEIQNEAGLIGLLTGDKELLRSAVAASGASRQDVDAIIESLQALKEPGREPSYRRLRQLLRDSSIDTQALLSVASLHNNQKGVHPSVATAAVLSLVPKLSKAQSERLLATRNDDSPSLISNPIESDYFSSTISAYYRISVSLELNGRRYTRLQIIKMINQKGRLYEVQAIL